MKLFIIWFIGFLLAYFIPSGIGAFISLDWSNLDFTTWSGQARVLLTFLELGWSGVFLAMIAQGLFDA